MNKYRLAIIFFFAFFVRIAAIVVIDSSTDILDKGFYSSAGREFSTIAHNIVAGEGFSLQIVEDHKLPSAYMPPGYVYFLVSMFTLFGEGPFSLILVQCLQALFGSLSCLALCKLADSIFPEKVGTLSAIMMALYPPLIYSVAEIHSLSIYILLNILLIWSLLRLSNSNRIGLTVLAGLLAGILALFRSEMVVFIPLLTLWLMAKVFRRGARWKPVLFFCTAVIIIAPWTIRNYRVFDQIVPIHTSSGYDFSRGHNPDATGTGMSYSGEPIEGASGIPGVVERISALLPSDDWEVRRDAIYMRAALDYIRNHPWNTIRISVMKFFYFWGIDITYPLARHPLYWISWVVVLPMAIMGIIKAVKRKMEVSILNLYLIFYTALEMIVFVLPRHRLFIEPLILIYASFGLHFLWRKWGKTLSLSKFSS